MNRPTVWIVLLLNLTLPGPGLAGQDVLSQPGPTGVRAVIRSEPLHSGRIDPRLFGNFVELLDDVAPGLRAELLNDRAFAGVRPMVNAVYYDGAPNFCDREWDPDPTWSYDPRNPMVGARCVRLSAGQGRPATLTQAGLAVKRGLDYLCSGWFRSDEPSLKAIIILKTRLPDGAWMTLARADLPAPTAEWKKHSVRLRSAGETDRVVFELRVEGTGSVWVNKLSCTPADHVKGWRRDVVEAVRELHPALIRWGGSVCDPGGYRWKNGIGDRDLRVPFPNTNWGRIDSNDVGIDEFCQLCEATATEPLLCVSFSDGSQSAGDLVEYCNGGPQSTWGARRAANGHPEPYRVKLWQIGNEIGGDDPRYLDQFPLFVRAMKQADPGVVLMSSFPSRRLLETHGREIGFVCPHHYTRDFAACDRDLDQIAEWLRNIPGCEGVRIAVTEWNESGGEWGLGRGRQMTLQNAVLNARYLNLLMRHSDRVGIACRSSLANSLCGGILETSPSGLLRRPGYYALQLYSRHSKPVPLKIESPSGGPDFFAGISEDRSSLVVFAVNSRDQEVPCTLEFAGFPATVQAAGAETLGDTLHAAQPDVMNHWEAPARIRITDLSRTTDGVTLPALSVTALEYRVN